MIAENHIAEGQKPQATEESDKAPTEATSPEASPLGSQPASTPSGEPTTPATGEGSVDTGATDTASTPTPEATSPTAEAQGTSSDAGPKDPASTGEDSADTGATDTASTPTAEATSPTAEAQDTPSDAGSKDPASTGEDSAGTTPAEATDTASAPTAEAQGIPSDEGSSPASGAGSAGTTPAGATDTASAPTPEATSTPSDEGQGSADTTATQGATEAANQGKKWFIVQAHSNFENKVAEAISHQAKLSKLETEIEEAFVPKEKVVEVRRGARVQSERKIFPGYVLVKMDMNAVTHNLIKNLPKVIGFLGDDNEKMPRPVSDEEINSIMRKVKEGEVAPKPSVSFVVGEQIRVSDGPFTSFNGIVEEVDEDKARLKVTVSIFGRSTPVELSYNQVEKG